MNEAMLSVSQIYCAYAAVPVIHGISLEVKEGEIVAIVGANGAGKSTTMRTIAGLMHPVKGSVTFFGEDVSHTPSYAMITKGISFVPEGRRLFSKLTVRENLELGSYIEKNRAVIDERLEEVFSLFPILKKRANQVAETMSGGEQQMCAIARGLMSRPKLLMLDELSLGLMPSLFEKPKEELG